MTRTAHNANAPRAAYSIREFCEAHRISVRAYFKMKAEGWGPTEMRIGKRVVISLEAAARWRAEREAAAAAGGTVPVQISS
jgi:hypothetical protein